MNEHEEEGFGLSIGDVMSALLLIIILLMMTVIQQLTVQMDKSSQFVTKQEMLRDALRVEFGADTSELFMHIAPDGEIQFIPPEGTVLFSQRKAQLDPRFKNILRRFFPRYLRTLDGLDFKDEVREIRIEGHTDPSTSGDDPYLDNIAFSQNRSYRVLKFILKDNQTKRGLDSLGLGDLSWFKERTVPMGFGLNKLVYLEGQAEIEIDSIASRRVTFRPLIDFERYMYLQD